MKLARFRPLLLTLSAATALGLGALLMADALERRAARDFAILDPAPRFQPLKELLQAAPPPKQEIALRAQLDRPRAYFIRINGGREAFAAPLYGAEAQRPENPVRAVLLEPAGAPSEKNFAEWVRAAGPAGTLVDVFGRRSEPDARTRRLVAKAFEDLDLRLAEDALFFDPHHRSRSVELSPSRAGPAVAAAALAIGLALAFMAWWSQPIAAEPRSAQPKSPTPDGAKKPRKRPNRVGPQS